MENKACSSDSTPKLGESFGLGNVYEAHMDHFFEQTSHSEKLKKLANDLMIKLASSVPCELLNSDLRKRVEGSLQKLAPSLQTPTHPTYALMIYTAIDELEGNGDSTTVETISKFIIENFEDLPLAHDLTLRRYIKKLCENKEIVCTSSNSYTLAEEAQRKWKRGRAFWKGSSWERDTESQPQEQEIVTEYLNEFNETEDQGVEVEGFSKRVHEQVQQCEVIEDHQKGQVILCGWYETIKSESKPIGTSIDLSEAASSKRTMKQTPPNLLLIDLDQLDDNEQ